MRSGGGRPAVEGERGFVLVGREDELALLRAALRSLPAVVLVEGEAGVGKSRLVREATAAMAGQGTRLLTGFCHPLREPLPFGPVLEALRPVAEWLPPPETLNPQAGALAPLLPELARHLPPAPDQPGDARSRRFQLVGAVRSVLEAIGPVVLVVEDLHWVDDATRELLLLLARDPPKKLALTLTYRGEDLAPDTPVLGAPYRRPVGTAGVEVHLDALAEPDLFELASTVLGHRATRGLARVLYERSAGLPLVVEEDLLTLQLHHRHEETLRAGGRQAGGRGPRAFERGSRRPGTGAAGDPGGGDDVAVLTGAEVPRYLREALAARLASLTAEGMAMVEAAAVLAVPADQSLLTEVAGLPSDRAATGLTEALQLTLLRESAPARYGFRHTLAQQTVYRDLLGPRREALHRQAVRTLWTRPSPPLVQIAHHTRALGDVQGWLRQAEAAADQAIAVGDDGTAATLINEILAQPDLEGDLRTRAALALARIAKEGVERATAITLRKILIDPQLPAAARGEIRLTLGLLLLNQALDHSGLAELERAVQELDSRPDLAARAMNALAVDERNRCQGATHVWMDRLEALTQQVEQGAPDERVWAAVCATRLSLLATAGDPAMWEMLEKLPRGSADREVMSHTARGLHNAGSAAIRMGHDEQANRLLEESCDLAQRLGHHLLECFSGLSLLWLDWFAGRWSTLEEDIARWGEEFPEVDIIGLEALLQGGTLSAARGQWQRALDQLGKVAARARRASEDDTIFRAAAGIARIHLARGEPEAAWTAVAPSLHLLHDVPVWLQAGELLSIAVRAALACGHQDRARDLVTAAEQVLVGKDAPAMEAEVHLARGLLLQHGADADGAAAHFDRARLLYDTIGRPYHAAQAAELLAATRVATAPGTAATGYTQAGTAYTALGAVADAARCQQALRDLGLARPTPRGRRGYGTELSPREKQVAELLADGASNQDIAQALSLSKRTVEMHVANTLKKLHATRDALTDRN
ncbi:ATP-binding protein [Kitasatospora sp. NPDC057015]|uniref:ATP-binding protein n=1 Tax=Kitasatospora sp. NPDC057015 TaxID=3346001 RepID=UPI003640A969